MPEAYRVAPIFVIRIAGVSFDEVEKLAAPQTSQRAREQIDAAKIENSLAEELTQSRSALLKAAREILPRYLVFAARNAREVLQRTIAHESPPRRDHQTRKRERSLLLYLQRVAAKNDTFSEFGPTGWGKIEKEMSGVKFAPQPGIARREIFLERWTAHAMAAVINSDPEIAQQKLPPLQVPALEPHAFEILRDDVAVWPPGAARNRWLSILQTLLDLAATFGPASTQDREKIIEQAAKILPLVDLAQKAGGRSLYSARNPIGEECFRECNFSIGEKLINEVATEAEPWIDLWRDCYACVASRVAAGLRSVLEKMRIQNGAAPLPDFLRACEMAKLPLGGPGLVGLAAMAFHEIKIAFAQRMSVHVGKAEYELSKDDCHFVRNNFLFPKFDEFTFPSADLQLAARSTEAIARGEYQWIVSELHPSAALLHHALYWSCPDSPAFSRAIEQVTCGKPIFHFGFFAADFTAHTTIRLFDALPEQANFVAPQRANPKWRTFPPGETEVYLDPNSGDVCLRASKSREHLGSFARGWIIPLGFHPFAFSFGANTPRLRCGKIIVQRRSWIISRGELGPGNFTGVSRDLVVAIEKLRARKNLPRFVYIRPTEQALRRSGAEGRDKDTKPVFIDLESYLFLEIFYRWLTKSDQLEVTEMLPAPDDLFWREKDGRRTFELRTLIVPRA